MNVPGLRVTVLSAQRSNLTAHWRAPAPDERRDVWMRGDMHRLGGQCRVYRRIRIRLWRLFPKRVASYTYDTDWFLSFLRSVGMFEGRRESLHCHSVLLKAEYAT